MKADGLFGLLAASHPSRAAAPPRRRPGNVHGGGGITGAPRGVGLRWPSDLAARVELRRSHP
jgi:hypothetical protein